MGGLFRLTLVLRTSIIEIELLLMLLYFVWQVYAVTEVKVLRSASSNLTDVISTIGK